jgi:hypothetical protein
MPAVSLTVGRIQDQADFLGPLTTGYYIQWDGTNFVLSNVSSAPGSVQSVNGQVGNVTLNTSNISEVSNLYYTDNRTDARIAAQKGVPTGLATLDSSGKILTNQIPAIALVDTFVVTSQAAMLGLTAQTGDVAIRTDLSQTFILQGNDPTVLGNWKQILVPASVSSVGLSAPTIFTISGSPVTSSGTLSFSLINQLANTVFAGPSSGASATPTFRVLTSADIPTIAESQVTGLVSDLGLKAPLASPGFTGTPTAPTATANTNTTQLATTAYIQNQGYVTATTAPVTSVFGRTGSIVPVTGDYSAISQAGGSVTTNTDGSITITALAGQNIQIVGTLLPFSVALNQNGPTLITVTNTLPGTAAIVEYRAVNDAGHFAYQGITSTGFSPAGALASDISFWISFGNPALYGSQSAQPIIFCQSLNEIARFDTSGRLGINTNTPSSLLDVNGTITQSGTNGQLFQMQMLTELTTIAAAASTLTAITIPANAIVFGVSVRVIVAIPTATTFTVTGNSSATVFNTASVSTVVNSTDPGTKSCPLFNATAQAIKITPSSVPATNVGRVRVTIYYYIITPPTS